MKYLYFSILLLIFMKTDLIAKEMISISGLYEVETPIFFENKTIVIEKNTVITANTNSEHAITVKNCELYFNGEIFNPVIVKSKKIDSEQNVFYIEDSKVLIKHIVFENNGWCLHVHNSDITIENTHFRNNFGGIRFFNSKTSIKKNLFEKHEIAIRFLNSNNNEINENIFYDNKIAIFIREGIQKNGIKDNAFIKNNYDFYSGFFQSNNLSFENNYFYGKPSVFDQTKDSDLTSIINVYPLLANFPDWH